ncbi:hypothetical protein B0T22DRAFT_286841 [Podospora appendiculata]|uniref:Uncharacterized protein n=1 Tax=Podospora appendiculata TaxID=314037 RepID=A0AAE0X167_9PEZI|nr:hypothetical protein B0T22DRAFT_286841 [Podospora appendiculata]
MLISRSVPHINHLTPSFHSFRRLCVSSRPYPCTEQLRRSYPVGVAGPRLGRRRGLWCCIRRSPPCPARKAYVGYGPWTAALHELIGRCFRGSKQTTPCETRRLLVSYYIPPPTPTPVFTFPAHFRIFHPFSPHALRNLFGALPQYQPLSLSNQYHLHYRYIEEIQSSFDDDDKTHLPSRPRYYRDRKYQV